MTEAGLRSGDTDWHLDTLYGWARALGASVLGARYSRYVVDLNRPSDDASLYPGQTKTGLCPTHTFRGEPIYQDGAEPDEAERARRLDAYWRPYHDKLRLEIERIRAEHGAVLLWEAHSIASVLPRLFEGKLPDLNIGTADGASCAPDVLDAIRQRLEGAAPYLGRQRPLQGRPHHAPLWQARGRGARGAAGDVPVDLHGRDLSLRLPAGIGGAGDARGGRHSRRGAGTDQRSRTLKANVRDPAQAGPRTLRRREVKQTPAA